MSSIPRCIAIGIAAVVVLTASPGFSRCGDDPNDAAAVAAARLEVENSCDCVGASSHRVYVSCARDVVRARVASGALPSDCKRDVSRCASRSTCGRPGAVTCCTIRNGESRCRVRRDARQCTQAGGTVGACPSCCDACGGTCTVPTACGHRFADQCHGECPPATPICANQGGVCQCVAGTAPCGPVGTFECDGVCPPGQACMPGGLATCGCVPAESSLCVESDHPSCGGACPGGATCLAVPLSATEVRCACPPVTCAGPFPTCGGACPGDATCTAVSFPFPSGDGCLCLP
jgi:hypothetical protein